MIIGKFFDGSFSVFTILLIYDRKIVENMLDHLICKIIPNNNTTIEVAKVKFELEIELIDLHNEFLLTSPVRLKMSLDPLDGTAIYVVSLFVLLHLSLTTRYENGIYNRIHQKEFIIWKIQL